jgi:flagellar protein FlbD
MIKLTRLNGSDFYLNADLIETLEATPDTVVTLTTNAKWVIRESPAEVVERVTAYKRQIYLDRPTVIGNSPTLAGNEPE